MLHSPLLEILLGLTEVGLSRNFAVDNHALATFSFEPARFVLAQGSKITIALVVVHVQIKKSLHKFPSKIVIKLFTQIGEFVA